MSSSHTDNPDTDLGPFRFVTKNIFELDLTHTEKVSLGGYFTNISHEQVSRAAEILPNFSTKGKIDYLRNLLQSGKQYLMNTDVL